MSAPKRSLFGERERLGERRRRREPRERGAQRGERAFSHEHLRFLSHVPLFRFDEHRRERRADDLAGILL